MIQQILVVLMVAGAVAYLARLAYRSFFHGQCASGCGRCAVADFKKIEKELKARGI